MTDTPTTLDAGEIESLKKIVAQRDAEIRRHLDRLGDLQAQIDGCKPAKSKRRRHDGHCHCPDCMIAFNRWLAERNPTP